ncbi:MAG TPA: DUF4253 domain-containing protein [Gemmataceae bacterium]|nr:DUF4253 domain-containing protein [Gemmataceae bacterium]
MEKLEAELKRAGVDVSSLALAFTIGKHRVGRLTVEGTEAIPTWKRLRKLVPKTGHWPVLLGTDEDLELLAENREDGEDQKPGKVLGKARRVNVPALFVRWQKVAVENAREALNEFRETPDAEDVVVRYERMLAQDAPFQGLPRGKWPKDMWPDDYFSIPYDVLTKKPHRRIHVGLVPTMNGWEVPAFLMFGSWNACPHPEHHVAIMKYWHEQYGAEVVGITHDIVEMLVARPPRSRTRALELAREQYLYCDDIVEQGMRDLDTLAATLRGGKVWYFWWD